MNTDAFRNTILARGGTDRISYCISSGSEGLIDLHKTNAVQPSCSRIEGGQSIDKDYYHLQSDAHNLELGLIFLPPSYVKTSE